MCLRIFPSTAAVARKTKGVDGTSVPGDAANVTQAIASFRLCSGETWRAPWPMYSTLRHADPAHHIADGDYHDSRTLLPPSAGTSTQGNNDHRNPPGSTAGPGWAGRAQLLTRCR